MEQSIKSIVAAAHYAAEQHKDQRRKSDDSPYINHPLSVAWLLITKAKIHDVNVLTAAILHDVVEDTSSDLEDIRCLFGDTVASIVSEVSDDKSLSKVERKRLQVERAPKKSLQARLVKLADKLHNLKDLQQKPPLNWSIDVVQGYFVWSMFVVDGMRGTNEGLERELDTIFNSKFLYEGVSYPVLPEGNLAEYLEKYYSLIE